VPGRGIDPNVMAMSCAGRILLLFVLLASGAPGFARRPALQRPPEVMPADMPELSPLLRDARGEPINTKSAWRRQREIIRREWLKFLGGLPANKPPLKAQILSSEELPDFTREQVRYQIEDGVFTDGYLLAPRNRRGQRPAVVVFHPTTPVQAKGVAGLVAEYEQEKWQGVQLARRGYVVLCPRNYIFTDGDTWTGNARRVLRAHPNWTGITRMVWDARRAVDFLESLPAVDRRRIGCLGHSLGGKQALYAAAFDERIQAAVSSEGGLGLRFSNWDAIWYLGPKVREPGFHLEHHQLLALVAPRAFLLLAGDSADGDRSWAYLAAALPVYELLGAPAKLGWFNHHLGHRYPLEARRVAEEFLDRHLKP
jgi:dienelactone hydrolase